MLTFNIDDQYFTREDKTLKFRIWTDTTKTTRQDITGWSISWMVKKRKTNADASALITKTTTGGDFLLTDPINGECKLPLDDADIDAIVGGSVYYHELKRMDTGFKTVQVQGTFILQQALHAT